MNHETEWIEITQLASGASLRLPLYHVSGRRGGPTLGVSAAIHGDEVVGIQVIHRLLERLVEVSFRGTVVCLPVANPLGFAALTRNTPLAVEIGNLNRVFPGDPNGDVVAMLAHAIVAKFLNRVDHLVDLHAGGSHPVVDYTISLRNLEAALAFGQRVVRPSDGYQGTLGAVAAAQGKTSVVAEVGGGYLQDERYVEMGLRGVWNIMRYFEMVDGTPERPAEQLVVPTVTALRPHQGGLLYSEVGPDQMAEVVPEGFLLGRVVSPYTFETLEELYAPYGRSVIVLLRPGVTRVNPGDYAYMLGDMETARSVRGGT